VYRQIGIRVFLVIDHISRFIYEATDGRIGAVQGNVRMLLLHSIGRKTGKIRTHCLQYQRDGNNYLVVPSNFGLPTSPAWYLNLKAHPHIKIQVGRQHLEVEAHTATPDERSRLWSIVTTNHPPYTKYQSATTREIPVVILTPT